MLPLERQNVIVSKLKEDRRVEVNNLSKMLDVSELTIRRDLDSLEEQGILLRSHGGAILNSDRINELDYTGKVQSNAIEKKAIAKSVSEYINNGDAVFINSGSTCTEIIREISSLNLKVTVITNNMEAYIFANKNCKFIFIGGEYRSQSRSTVGNSAILNINGLKANKAIIGTDAISFEYGLTAHNEQESYIAKTMIDNCFGTKFVVADSSKVGNVLSFVTSYVTEFDYFITDKKSISKLKTSEQNNKDVKIVFCK